MTDDRIKITVRYHRIYKTYRARVSVNGEFYASVDAPSREQALSEANHYAAQIEFDEEGYW
jgi:hypothetical protein